MSYESHACFPFDVIDSVRFPLSDEVQDENYCPYQYTEQEVICINSNLKVQCYFEKIKNKYTRIWQENRLINTLKMILIYRTQNSNWKKIQKFLILN